MDKLLPRSPVLRPPPNQKHEFPSRSPSPVELLPIDRGSPGPTTTTRIIIMTSTRKNTDVTVREGSQGGRRSPFPISYFSYDTRITSADEREADISILMENLALLEANQGETFSQYMQPPPTQTSPSASTFTNTSCSFLPQRPKATRTWGDVKKGKGRKIKPRVTDVGIYGDDEKEVQAFLEKGREDDESDDEIEHLIPNTLSNSAFQNLPSACANTEVVHKSRKKKGMSRSKILDLTK